MTSLSNGEIGLALANILLLGMLFVIGVAIARLRSLFAIVMLSGLYSLISATWFVLLDAVDVAFTEAAVGAGISTALTLGAMLLTARTAKAEKPFSRIAPFAVVAATGALLVYASLDLPAVGDAQSPVNTGVGADQLARHYGDMGFPNVITSILASYRGIDTLGEVTVVFAAGLAVALLLGFGERSLADSPRDKGGR